MEQESKGLWMPKEILHLKGVTPTEKMILAEISAFKGNCWASNAHFSELCQVSKNRISHIIAGLIEKKYVAASFIYKPNSKEIERRFLKVINPPIVTDNNTPIVIYNKEVLLPTTIGIVISN